MFGKHEVRCIDCSIRVTPAVVYGGAILDKIQSFLSPCENSVFTVQRHAQNQALVCIPDNRCSRCTLIARYAGKHRHNVIINRDTTETTILYGLEQIGAISFKDEYVDTVFLKGGIMYMYSSMRDLMDFLMRTVASAKFDPTYYMYMDQLDEEHTFFLPLFTSCTGQNQYTKCDGMHMCSICPNNFIDSDESSDENDEAFWDGSDDFKEPEDEEEDEYQNFIYKKEMNR
jgi:hypothetical protein